MRRHWSVGLAFLWLVSLPFLSHAQAVIWTDERALWQQAAWWGPLKVRPWAQLGEIAYRRGELDLAVTYFDRAVRVYEAGHRPAFERAGCEIAVQNMGLVLMHLGRFREAVEWSADRCG